jgi:ribosomal protein S17
MDWLAFAGAAVTALFSLIGVIVSNKATRDVVIYRVEQLEKKVDKHNQVVERTFKLEQKVEDLEKKVG